MEGTAPAARRDGWIVGPGTILAPSGAASTIRMMAAPPPSQFTTVAMVYDRLMQVVPYGRWVDYVEDLWERFHTAPRTVLDVACGTGNVLLELKERHYDVAGVDYSATMIEEARRKAGAGVEIFCQDVRALDVGRSFDAAVCLFDSLNYLLEEEHLQQAFASVRRHLNPGALFTWDMNTIHALEAGMFNQQGREDPDLAYHWRSHYDAATRLCRIEMDFTVRNPAGERTFHETHVQRGYTLGEILNAVAAGGLDVLVALDSFTFNPPRGHSDRCHFVARRPG